MSAGERKKRWATFGEWKAYAMAFFAGLKLQDAEADMDRTALMSTLEYAKSRDLARMIMRIHSFGKKHGIDVSNVIPTPEEVDAFFRSGD